MTTTTPRAELLVISAKRRAAIVAHVNNNGPTKRADLLAVPFIAEGGKNLDNLLATMVKQRLIQRTGKPGRYVYKPINGSAVDAPAPVKIAARRAPTQVANGIPTVRVDLDRQAGRLRLTVTGPLVIDLGT